MTDLREAIARALLRERHPCWSIVDEIMRPDSEHYNHDGQADEMLGLADAVIAILPDAEALAVIAGNIASYIDLNDCDGRSNDDALEIPLGDLRRLRVALANYRKGTGREG